MRVTDKKVFLLSPFSRATLSTRLFICFTRERTTTEITSFFAYTNSSLNWYLLKDSSDDICIIVINVLELRKAKLSTVFSKLLLKNKAAINTVLPLAYALLRKTFKENAPGYLLFTQRNMSKSKGHNSATRYVVAVM